MPDEEPTLNEGTPIPEGSSPPEPEPISTADDGSTPAAGDTGAQEPEEPRGPVPYDRFATVARERKAMEEAAKAAGLQWDSESKQFVKPEPDDSALTWDDADNDEGDPGSNGGYAEDPELAEAMANPAFWQMKPAQMAADPMWQRLASENDFDLSEMVPNEWNVLKKQVAISSYIEQAEQQQAYVSQQQQQIAEQRARTEVVQYLSKLDEDAALAASPAGRKHFEAEVKAMKASGQTAAQIKAMLPFIRNAAIATGLDEIVQAGVQAALKGEGSRKITLGAQSPSPQGSTGKPVVNLTATERALCDSAGVSYERYAARKEANA